MLTAVFSIDQIEYLANEDEHVRRGNIRYWYHHHEKFAIEEKEVIC